MSYIGRFFKWIFSTITDIFRQGLIWTFRQAMSVIRRALPVLIRVVFSALGVALQLSVIGFLATVRPTREVATKLGEDWSDTAVREGWVPSLHQATFTKIFIVVAFLAIFLGFLFNLFTVILTVDLVYYLITLWLKTW